MPSLTFIGATGHATGSCYLLQLRGLRVLLECGLFQGPPEVEDRNRRPFPFEPSAIDAVILSHAHLDHSRLLPRLEPLPRTYLVHGELEKMQALQTRLGSLPGWRVHIPSPGEKIEL